MEIMRYFHFVDNTTAPSRSDPNYNKLWKIQPLVEKLSETNAQMYSPHPQLSIDESRIGTKCRLFFVQYITAKPVKWGIKVWVCSDSVNGYVCSFSIYTGKNPVHEKGLAYSVVTKLMEGYSGKGYTVYTDNYYTSPLFCKDLLEKNTYSSCTVRTDRKQFPRQLCEKSADSNRGIAHLCTMETLLL